MNKRFRNALRNDFVFMQIWSTIEVTNSFDITYIVDFNEISPNGKSARLEFSTLAGLSQYMVAVEHKYGQLFNTSDYHRVSEQPVNKVVIV